jgi:hypothetical protein
MVCDNSKETKLDEEMIMADTTIKGTATQLDRLDAGTMRK